MSLPCLGVQQMLFNDVRVLSTNAAGPPQEQNTSLDRTPVRGSPLAEDM